MLMTTTFEEAIQGRISKLKTEFSGNNGAIVRTCRIRIDTLTKAPKDLESVESAIEDKNIELEKARKLDEMQKLHSQIEMLEFVRTIIIFEKERDRWATS